VDHKKLLKSHTKLEEAHSSLVKKCENMPTNVEKAKTCNIGISCDIINESFHKSIVVAPTNPSYSSSTSSSSNSDGFTCDSTLIAENKNLKKEVKELNHTLVKTMVVRTACLCAWVAKELLSTKRDCAITLRKARPIFAPHKTRFMKNNGSYCKSCKQVGHIEQQCMNKKSNANVSLIKFDSFYMLTKGTNGVHAKFIGTPWMGSKKKAIWVPKSLVTNLGGPKQVWVPKKN
jgi:hypothetical protein